MSDLSPVATSEAVSSPTPLDTTDKLAEEPILNKKQSGSQDDEGLADDLEKMLEELKGSGAEAERAGEEEANKQEEAIEAPESTDLVEATEKAPGTKTEEGSAGQAELATQEEVVGEPQAEAAVASVPEPETKLEVESPAETKKEVDQEEESMAEPSAALADAVPVHEAEPATSIEPAELVVRDLDLVEKEAVEVPIVPAPVALNTEAVEAFDLKEAEAEKEVEAKRSSVGPVYVAEDVPEPSKRALAPSPIEIPSKESLNARHAADDLHAPDSPTTFLISSLRSQLLSLSDQTHALNAKLIASISRSADLEDELHNVQDQHVALGEKAKSLEEQRDRWEDSMKTGLLVERDQIRDEMQRLAAGLVEEERRRGSAEERREQVENEVDDLTAKLFDQANTMVATERMSRAQAEARLKSTEENLANAEAVVQAMQLQLQNMSSSALSGPSEDSTKSKNTRKFISSHIPYSEFLTFLQYLRAARPLPDHLRLAAGPPLITSLLTHHFVARILSEDQEPTLRLEAAPALSIFSRRSVGAAIISGDLVIEPVSLYHVLTSTGAKWDDLSCSMCGKKVFGFIPPSPAPGGHFGTPVPHPQRSSGSGASRFSLKPFFNSSATPPPPGPSPTASPLTSPAPGSTVHHSTSVFIFRIARSQGGATTPSGEKENSKLYPLCKSGWCLERLRATCELWHFVKNGIVHQVWASEDGTLTEATTAVETVAPVEVPPSSVAAPSEAAAEHIQPPPLPARKKSWGLGLWRTSDSASDAQSSKDEDGSDKKDDADSEVGSVGAEKDDVYGPHIVEEATRKAEEKERKEKEEKELAESAVQGKAKVEEAVLDESAVAEGEEPKSVEMSRNNSGSDASFATPKSEAAELPPVDEASVEEVKEETGPDAEVEKKEEEAESKKEQVIDITTPTISSTPQLGGSPVTPIGSTPPPIPKRAAARNRLSQLGASSNGGSTSSLVEETKESEKVEETESKVDGSSEDKKSILPPPPHHPKTFANYPPPPPPHGLSDAPLAPPPRRRVHSQQAVAEAEEKKDKTFCADGSEEGQKESWEEKTWKGVVRLKENMWKARVGVVDEE
ncbi:hypothetical protein L202_03628 [Cryptococcus amylolentus CBS 6039]|uniref:GDP/GTP exchange factor Sec2 N-terminal domain-containing protein n=2 Tax=Cryptococcus amylolentus TaxID=104669 RepID=A0A1E3HTM3_9TREE|nr:hypothetical protein L202_03628 [Cryptococcus amylolentus CBS 6039]ODN79703.1 hypothetical protein L202_03628 [Cryptococcus amylolentus CBS 6039]ODO08004.1 hypothetical protein I350_03587 [Cryptococcus amylolentus CBS 6273]